MQKLGEYELVDATEKYMELIYEWRNSEYVRPYMFSEHVISKEEHKQWFERVKTGRDIIAKLLLFKKKPIGFVNFTNIDYENNKCYWGFYIGDQEAPKGSGKIMGILALNYIFEEFHLRKLCSEILDFNHKSIMYHKKLAFIEEGTLKKHIYKNNRYADVIVMALFREDWARAKDMEGKYE